MWPILLLSAGVVLFLSLRKQKAPIPNYHWKLFNLPWIAPINEVVLNRLQGVYAIQEGKEIFGNFAVAKWSYVIEAGKKVYHLSFFSENDNGYIICEGKKLKNRILLNGYWCKPTRGETGRARFVISAGTETGTLHPGENSHVIISGKFGCNEKIPDQKIVLEYRGALQQKGSFHILGHRGGGRNLDYSPHSENSLELVKLAPQLGATGVEVDVQLTADKVPVLLHDFVLSVRTIRNYKGIKLLKESKLNDLRKLRLKKGEQIPTLREALDLILYQTALELVWMDVKYHGNIQPVRDLQSEYLKKAADAGRNLEIFIGIADKEVLQHFMKLDDFKNIPSLTELELEDVENIKADIWAPRWAGGLQNDEVRKIKAKGKRAFVWTVDAPELVDKYMHQGEYDGMLTNFPSLVAYSYYISQP